MPTYRGDGAWGVGKGAALTSAEFDGNTYDFDTRITTLEGGGAAALSVTNVTMLGSQLTFTFSDASTFTVTVPRATGFDVYTVATLPAAPASGSHAYASNALRSGETTGAGTGCPVFFDGTNWRTFYDNTVAAA